MTPDELTDSLEFDQQITLILSQENGQQEVLKFLAKETRSISIKFSALKDDLVELISEHNERVNSGAVCSTEVNIAPQIAPSQTLTKKAMAVAGGAGGIVALVLLIILLLILKSMGFTL